MPAFGTPKHAGKDISAATYKLLQLNDLCTTDQKDLYELKQRAKTIQQEAHQDKVKRYALFRESVKLLKELFDLVLHYIDSKIELSGENLESQVYFNDHKYRFLKIVQALN